MRSVNILESHRQCLLSNLVNELDRVLPSLPSCTKNTEFENMVRTVYLDRAVEIENTALEHGLSGLLTKTAAFYLSRKFSPAEVGNAYHTDLGIYGSIYLSSRHVKIPEVEIEALFAPETAFVKGLAVTYPAMVERIKILNEKSAARAVERMDYRDGAYNRIKRESTSGKLIDLLNIFPAELVTRMHAPAPGKKAIPSNMLPPKFSI